MRGARPVPNGFRKNGYRWDSVGYGNTGKSAEAELTKLLYDLGKIYAYTMDLRNKCPGIAASRDFTCKNFTHGFSAAPLKGVSVVQNTGQRCEDLTAR
jgi:hypothetical protein